MAGGLALAAALLWVGWPGVALYDTLVQFTQLRAHEIDDWHPPVMARLWELTGGGTASLFVLQVALFSLGLTLFAAAVRPQARVLAVAAVVLLIPTDWMTVVVKDAQMLAALTAATGLVVWFRLRRGALPGWAIALVFVLVAYALLLRANAVFAVAPLVCAWAGWGGLRRWPARAALLLAATLAVIAVSPPINHRLLGASASHVERVLPLYDLAGIAHFAGAATIPGLPPALWREAERRRCYHPYLWDPYGDGAACAFVAEHLAFGDGARANIFADWLSSIVAHPRAYATHRLAHFNATMRFLVPFGQPNASAPPDSQPNDAGLGVRIAPGLRALARVTAVVAATPIGWPVVWFAAALGLWATAAGTPHSGPRDMALALALSASCSLASFAVVSIASDLRYHLWSIVAVVLGGVALTRCAGVPRRRLVATAVAVAAVALAGTIARATLVAGRW